jgi:hypothetical protein
VSCRPNRLLLASFLPALAWAAPSDDDLFFKSIAEVNEGELRFLAQPPAKAVHHHQNHIVVTDDSLATGWIKLEQCHRHLDAVPSMQIVYRPDGIRGLTILRSENIGKVWVHQHTVQLEQVGADALICIRAESRALSPAGDGLYGLANGPYMRRFLDGYYPMHVTMQVRIDSAKLRFLDISPAPQPGFSVHQAGQEIGYDTWFEGRLNTLIRFRESPRPAH